MDSQRQSDAYPSIPSHWGPPIDPSRRLFHSLLGKCLWPMTSSLKPVLLSRPVLHRLPTPWLSSMTWSILTVSPAIFMRGTILHHARNLALRLPLLLDLLPLIRMLPPKNNSLKNNNLQLCPILLLLAHSYQMRFLPEFPFSPLTPCCALVCMFLFCLLENTTFTRQPALFLSLMTPYAAKPDTLTKWITMSSTPSTQLSGYCCGPFSS